MKKLLLFLCGGILALSASAYSSITLPVIPPDPALEAKVQNTLSKMTLEEKIGQMTQIQVDILGGYDKNEVIDSL